MVEAGGGSSSLLGGSDEILGWLDVLLKGKPEQQAVARTEIAMILEARGFADDAEEAYWTNVQARAADRRSYERPIALYRLRRDKLSESLVRRQLDEVFAAPDPPRPARALRPAEPRAPREPRQPSNAPVSLARQLTSPSPPAQPTTPGQASVACEAPATPTRRPLPLLPPLRCASPLRPSARSCRPIRRPCRRPR